MKKWIVIVALIIVISVVAGVIFGIRRNAAKESSRAQAELGEWRRDPETNLPIFDRADGKPAFVSGELIISFSDEASVRIARQLYTAHQASKASEEIPALKAIKDTYGITVDDLSPVFIDLYTQAEQTGKSEREIQQENIVSHGGTITAETPLNMHQVYEFKFSVADNDQLIHILGTLEQRSDIRYVQPNFIFDTQLIPNEYTGVTDLQANQWGLEKTKTQNAWDTTTGSMDTVIAIVDTGIDYTHTDLSDNIWFNPGELPGVDTNNDGVVTLSELQSKGLTDANGNGRIDAGDVLQSSFIDNIDNDGNTYVDDVMGWDFVSVTTNVAAGEDGGPTDRDPKDFVGHGTLVAGVAAAVTNNAAGIAGTCWNCRIMPVRAMYENVSTGGTGNSSDISKAIIYAYQQGADVINVSFGSLNTDFLLNDAVTQAYANNTMVIAAAGNDNSTAFNYPASILTVVSVGASDENDARWVDTTVSPPAGSNYASTVAFFAPGVRIKSTKNGGGYALATGTSLATPHVSGIAALMLSQNRALGSPYTFDEVRSKLIFARESTGTGFSRVNAQMAVESLSGTAPVPSCNNNGTCDTAAGETTANCPADCPAAPPSTSPVGTNVAPVSSATASSQNTSQGQTASKAIDGTVDGYPADHTKEWASVSEKAGAWLRLDWSTSKATINAIRLFDRINTDDQVLSGTIVFSDGSSVSVSTLPNDGGSIYEIPISPAKTGISYLTFTINSVSATTQNIGLAEIEVWGAIETTSPPTTPPTTPPASTSPTSSCTGGIPGLGGDHIPDLNADGCVNAVDLSILLGQWGERSTPGSGTHPPGSITTAGGGGPGTVSTPKTAGEYPLIGWMTFGPGTLDFVARYPLFVSRAYNASTADTLHAINPDLKLLYTEDWNAGCGISNPPSEWNLKKFDGTPVDLGYDSGKGSQMRNLSKYNKPSSSHGNKTYQEACADRMTSNIDVNKYYGIQTDGLWGKEQFKWALNAKAGWSDMDMDEDGIRDLDQRSADAMANDWQEGIDTMLSLMRQKFNAKKSGVIMVINAGSQYSWGRSWINGYVREKFSVKYNDDIVESYPKGFQSQALSPFTSLALGLPDPSDPDIKNNPLGESRDHLPGMRFGLVLAMMNDMYFSFQDADSGNPHSVVWSSTQNKYIYTSQEHYWSFYYDEFETNLGKPTDTGKMLKDGIGYRCFEKGIALYTYKGQPGTFTASELSGLCGGYTGPYYKLLGGQDMALKALDPSWVPMNDGTEVNSITLRGLKYSISRVGDGVLLFREPTVAVTDIIIDDSYSGTSPTQKEPVFTGFTQTGGSSGCSSATNAYFVRCGWNAFTYPLAESPGGGSNTAVYVPTIGVPGKYEVFEWHGTKNGETMATNVTYTVYHDNAGTNVTVNQQQNVGQWNSLGTFDFSTAGSNYMNAGVIIKSSGANGYVVADAIKFVYVPSASPGGGTGSNPPPPTQPSVTGWDHSYPKLGLQQFGDNSPNDWYAKFDLVVSKTGKAKIDAVKAINPNTKYIYMEGVSSYATGPYDLPSLCPNWPSDVDSWGAKEGVNVGDPINPNPSMANGIGWGTRMTNPTDYGIVNNNGEKLNQYIPRCLAQRAFDRGYDGVGSDWFVINIFTDSSVPKNIDLNRNGTNDYSEMSGDAVERLWETGKSKFLANWRTSVNSIFGTDAPIWLNTYVTPLNTGDVWTRLPGVEQNANGYMNEGKHGMIVGNFQWTWNQYNEWFKNGRKPSVVLIEAWPTGSDSYTNKRGHSKNYFELMRFLLGYTMTGDGYFQFHPYEENEHQYYAYYDEYDVPLGQPTTGPIQLSNGIMLRFFDNGVLALNTNSTPTVVQNSDISTAATNSGAFTGPYYRFKGNQDPVHNDGSQFSSITLDAHVFNGNEYVGDAIILTKQPWAVVADIIVDNEENFTSPGSTAAALNGFTNQKCTTTAVGSQYFAHYCGSWKNHYAFAQASPSSNATAVFTPTINVAGTYKVYEWHGTSSSGALASNVNYTVTHGSGTDVKAVNQLINTNQWNLLGTYSFNTGKNNNVIISASGSNGYVVADAIKFVYVP